MTELVERCDCIRNTRGKGKASHSHKSVSLLGVYIITSLLSMIPKDCYNVAVL